MEIKLHSFRILDLQSDQVTIKGHVFEPGTYSLKAFPSLKSLILDGAKGYLPDVYFDKVDVYSIVDGIESVKSFNLSEILLNEREVSLNDLDVVYVYSNQRVEGDKTISISGFGTQPSTISWKENFSFMI